MSQEQRRSALAIVLFVGVLVSCADEKFVTVDKADASTASSDAGSSDGAASDGDTPPADASSCPDIKADFVFTKVGGVARFANEFKQTPTITRFSNDVGGGQCPMAFDPLVKVPYKTVLVQNATGVPVQLSAWAICKPTDDAYLAFYNRTTPPVTNLEISDCTGFVSEGSGNNGTGRGSPDSNGAMWCPGLTVQNGGSLPLAPCASALILFTNHEPNAADLAPAGLQIQVN
jgi:hypothetical protein